MRIQSAWRGKMQRLHLAANHRAASKIQAAFRGYVAHSAFLQLRKAVILLQVMPKSVVSTSP